MKKVININFQGRIIPIEESAYDMLKQYVESLRIFFATEEGKDEIINDIESRIAELFSEILKKGSTCITEADVTTIINSMGRPEDFDDDETKVQAQLGGNAQQGSYASDNRTAEPRGRLYRNLNDRLLGGVCSGAATYLRVDPTIVRILFAIITLGGFGLGFVLYIVLWIVLPAKGLEANLKKRLYRNPDDRVIGGVAGGLASYFNIQVWVPRIIFALPLIFGVITSVFQNAFFDYNPFPAVIFGSFGSSLLVIYIILWIVIPEANSATEKLEMRGEKVDLNSIANTVKVEMEGFRGRAERVGTEFKQKATAWGEEFKTTAQERSEAFASEVAPVARRTGNRLGNAIGILFKAFFLFVAGIVVFALLMALLGLMIGGVSVFPLKDFFLQGFWQNFLAWATLLLFLGAPVIAFFTWIIRRIIGVKSKNKYLGYMFAGLWVIGLFCGIILAASIAHDFSTVARERQEYTLIQPTSGKLLVSVPDGASKVYGRWFKMDGLLSMTDDSIYLNNVRVRIVKSPDSGYHAYAIKSSNAGDDRTALNNARSISYRVDQRDSVLSLARGFALTRGTRFRNQSVIMTIQVPVGKRIKIDRSVSRKLNYFHFNDRHNDWDDEWTDFERWDDNVEYIMTTNGLERVDKKDKEDQPADEMNEIEELNRNKEEIRKSIEEKQRELDRMKKELNGTDSTYRYKPEETKPVAIDKVEARIIPASTPPSHNDIINPMTSFLSFID
ncbi:PspC domain-containing protein [Segetibacter sp. 3557_3]|uniref:PspC domain-containing protein n=1 Tax=Segetibacter sp. 3557_3 TaxID=2547429 RepID=UPI001058FC0C|nr:PspC domain-containing protein [Segetibacter sp. 3557_3]TDH19713.1 PspC domain-containing protein [Segetibacter sp. 3557_3]